MAAAAPRRDAGRGQDVGNPSNMERMRAIITSSRENENN